MTLGENVYCIDNYNIKYGYNEVCERNFSFFSEFQTFFPRHGNQRQVLVSRCMTLLYGQVISEAILTADDIENKIVHARENKHRVTAFNREYLHPKINCMSTPNNI